jgi:hypothetical protein
MELYIDGRSVDVVTVYLPDMSATAALQAAHAVPADVPLLVIGPRVHGSSAETLRTKGIWYVDEAGNAYLRHHALIVDVRGRRGLASTTQSQRLKAGPTNPFTPKRARVVLALLSEPGLADAQYREIADRSGVSLGMTKGTMDTLEIAGFVEQIGARRRLIRGGELLDLWASAYPGGLGRANTLLVARGDVESWSPPDGIEIAVSGEQALPGAIRHPETLVLYIDSGGQRRPLSDLMLSNRWHSDPHGNAIIRELFWRNLPPISNVGTAPPVLVYADLLASHEPRQIEVAREMRNHDERLVQL